MHVGLVIYGTLETVSGGYLYDRKLVEFLRANGDTVAIISVPWRNYAQHLTDNLSRQLLAQMTEPSFDILLQDELIHPSLAWLNRRVRREIRCPVVSIVHHLRVLEQHHALAQTVYRTVEKWYLATIDAFIFNSETTRSTVADLEPETALKPAVVAVPAGDRFGRITPLSKPPSNELRIIFVGNVIARKGLHTLLDAVRLLPENGWHLDVVGSLDVDRRYVERIRPKLLHPAVTVHGGASDEQLAQLLQSADVLVVPSQYEGFGIVYLEAMGFGCVPVGSTGGAAHEIITDGDDGFLVPPGESTLLASRLLCLYSNDYLLTMRKNALRRFSCHPTWSETSVAIRQFLQSLTTGS